MPKELKPLNRWFSPSIGKQLTFSHLTVIAVVLLVIGFSLLTLAQNYFMTALEESLLFQADLISTSLIPGSTVTDAQPQPQAAFNTIQSQQLGNLSVEVQNLDPGITDPGSLTETFDLANLKEAAVQLNSVLDSSISLFNLEGELVLSSGVEPDYDPHQVVALLHTAMQGQIQSDVLRDDWLALSTPILMDEKPIGVLLLSHPLRDVEAVINDLLLRFLMAAALATLLAGSAGVYMARRLQRPITSLTSAAEALGGGDFNQPLPPHREDELGELSKAFQTMRDQLHQLDTTRRQFISDVSHELRTPLTGIKGLVETLQDGAVNDPQVRDRFLASIETETDRLIRLANDLLTLNRLDSSALDLKLEPIVLAPIIESLSDTYWVEAEKRNVTIQIRLSEPAAQINVDRDRFEQVMVNLLDNALKNAPSGSIVQFHAVNLHVPGGIDLRDDPSKPIDESLSGQYESLRHLAKGEWLLIQISDQGEGIPRDALPHVFERFYRADSARARDRGGSGLGLPIAKALIEAHGGEIWVESPIPDWSGDGNPGTRATIALPLIIT